MLFFFNLDVYADKTFKSLTDDGHLQGGLNQSYTCQDEKQLILKSGKMGNPGNITVNFQKLKIQPFPANKLFPNGK